MPGQHSTNSFGVFMGEGGLTLTVTLKKSGGSFFEVIPEIVDHGNGWYTITPLAAHRDTAGINNWLFVAGDIVMPYAEEVTTLSAQIQSIQTSLVGVDGTLTGIAGNVTVVLGVLADMDTTLDGIEVDLDDLATDIETEFAIVNQSLGGLDTLSGPNVVTATVVDDADSQPIELANVRLYRTGESGSKPTDDEGEVQFAVNTALFAVAISAAGYQGLVTTLDAVGDVAPTYRLLRDSANEPGDPQECALDVYVKINTVPIEGAKVQAKLVQETSAVDGVILSTRFVSAETNAAGYVRLVLVREDQFTDGDGVYLIEAFHDQKKIWSIKTAMPNTAVANLEDLKNPS